MRRRINVSVPNNFTRRSILQIATVGIATISAGRTASAEPQEYTADPQTIEAWMDSWAPKDKLASGVLQLSRFADPIYFLLKSIAWTPNSNQTDVHPVTVPPGFVTDFASIPRVFWTALKPDGKYAWAAVVHDYLYWFQPTSREESDKTFMDAMEDFDIGATTTMAIYTAVRSFGWIAWNENNRLKSLGVKRILTHFPTSPTILSKDWLSRAENFE